MPGLCVSQLGLEQLQDPPAWCFLKALHFLFCLRSKVLSRFVKLPAFSARVRAEASCLPSHTGRFPPSTDGGYSWCGVFPGLSMAGAARSADRYAAVAQTRMGVG